MNPVAHYALTGSIVASTIGGLALCALIIKYGFLPAEDEPASALRRRVFLTRLTHTIAATCFAVTALLSVVALAPRAGGVPARVRSTEPPELADQLRAVDARVSAIESLVRQLNTSVEALLARVEARAPRPAATDRSGR